ncbi:hypothetical protein ACL02U_29925 [Streptomyces sp. MS06]|uniref:hypothetical protein n=1 Tax=Streptomyces sp. MS06 TaxID=3385974 RepID=UPI00399FCFC3
MDATGIGPVDSVVVWAGVLTVLSGFGALLWRVLRAVLRIADRADALWEDWAGAEARPGVPERPGVMARLGQHDERLADHEVRIAHVESRSTETGGGP